MALVEVSPEHLSNLQRLRNKGIGGVLFPYGLLSSVPLRLLSGSTVTPLVLPQS